MNTAEVVVVGAGVIGTSVAYRLAERGLQVLLVDRSGIAAGTSGACDQAILLQSKKPGRHLELARASAQVYETIEDELEAGVEYQRQGGMILIETEEQLRVMTSFVQQQRRAGLSVDLISGEEARRRQPGLAAHLVGATWSAEDAQVNPTLLAFAFARAARRHGARLHFGVEVTGLISEGQRVIGVGTDRGPIMADQVVLASGFETPALAVSVGRDLPIRPRRGQLLITEATRPMIFGDILCARYIASKLDPTLAAKAADPGLGVGLSLGQTASGNLLIGGTREMVGADRSTTMEGLRAVVKHALRLVPALSGIRVIRTIAGLRPFTPDGLPIIGRDPDHPGLILAAGHEGDGIALAPITGLMVVDLIAGGPLAAMADGLGPERFESGNLSRAELGWR